MFNAEYPKFDNDEVHSLCLRPFSASFVQKIHWHFDITWLISQQFTGRDLEPVDFLVSFKMIDILLYETKVKGLNKI